MTQLPQRRRDVAVLALRGSMLLAGSMIFSVRVQAARPPRPTGVQIQILNGAANLTWNPSATATTYQVLRALVSGRERPPAIGAPASTSYLDATPVAGSRNFYVVRACNASGCSGNSAEVSAQILAAPLLQPAQSAQWSVVLSWPPVAGAVVYQAYRGTQPGKEGTTVVSVFPTSPGTDPQPTGGGTVNYYVLEACDHVGCSKPSNEVTGLPAAQPPASATISRSGCIGPFFCSWWFNWKAVAGANTYKWSIPGGPGGTITVPPTFTNDFQQNFSNSPFNGILFPGPFVVACFNQVCTAPKYATPTY